MFNCPYCDKNLSSWISVRAHTSKCSYNTGKFYIHKEYGIFTVEDINKYNSYDKLVEVYENIAEYSDLKKKFGTKLQISNTTKPNFSKADLLNFLVEFYKQTGLVPTSRDFRTNQPLPDTSTFEYHFGSWDNALKSAGLPINIKSGFGIRTRALDNHVYRSKIEALFVNKFLFGKYNYCIEPNYTDCNYKYDWYIPELDLYIELDGGLRPQRMLEKININSKLNRNFLVIEPKDIYSKKDLLSFKTQLD